MRVCLKFRKFDPFLCTLTLVWYVDLVRIPGTLDLDDMMMRCVKQLGWFNPRYCILLRCCTLTIIVTSFANVRKMVSQISRERCRTVTDT